MALTPEDLAQLGDFIEGKIKDAVGEKVAEATAPPVHTNDEAQNQPDNQPDFYVHLADGSVVVSKDNASTHMTNSDGESVAVIGRYPKVTA